MTEAGKNIGIVETQIVRVVENDQPLELECGKKLGPIDVAYETYGRLNEQGDNVVLICHALSGTAHAAGKHSEDDRKPGWWDNMIGPGKGIDTNKYFVICSNFLGGCSGTTGPSCVNPQTGKPFGLDFPMITISDMVKVQKLLIDKLGVKKLIAVVGGSMGGMQALQWAIDFPDMVRSVLPIATTSRLGAQAIAFDAVGRHAILNDAKFNGGDYPAGDGPDHGLAMARMIGHITYLSEKGMRRKFGRNLRKSDKYNFDFNSEFSVETYLDHQGQSFVERFDANSYLYITKAMDYFDLHKGYGSLAKAFANVSSRFLVISFTSDWLFTAEQSQAIVDALAVNEKDVSYCNIDSPYGHDSFLLEPETLGRFIKGFLDSTYEPGIRKTTNPLPIKGRHRHDEARRVRVDYELIERQIEPGSRVLDIGCGDGELLANLTADKKIKGNGIELSQDQVLAGVTRGLSITQHDIELGLSNFGDKSFDYVILSQTVQTVKNPEQVMSELLRVGRKVIVSFPNFAHWRCRKQLFFNGRAPVSKQLPFKWYDSPNIHFLSLKDFDDFCHKLGAKIEKRIPLGRTRLMPIHLLPNLLARQVVYVTSK